jgi:hypothetical protein
MYANTHTHTHTHTGMHIIVTFLLVNNRGDNTGEICRSGGDRQWRWSSKEWLQVQEHRVRSEFESPRIGESKSPTTQQNWKRSKLLHHLEFVEEAIRHIFELSHVQQETGVGMQTLHMARIDLEHAQKVVLGAGGSPTGEQELGIQEGWLRIGWITLNCTQEILASDHHFRRRSYM